MSVLHQNSGVRDGFPNTSLVLVKHGYNPELWNDSPTTSSKHTHWLFIYPTCFWAFWRCQVMSIARWRHGGFEAWKICQGIVRESSGVVRRCKYGVWNVWWSPRWVVAGKIYSKKLLAEKSALKIPEDSVHQRLQSKLWRQYGFVHNSCRCLHAFTNQVLIDASTCNCMLLKTIARQIFGSSLPHSLAPSHSVHWRTHPPNCW